MGNSIKAGSNYDPEGPGSDVAFFQAMNIRWLNVFIAKIRQTRKADFVFTLQESAESLKWSDYFRIFIEIKESMVSELSTKERSEWHPATKGYSMLKMSPDQADAEEDDHSEAASDKESVADDFTEDDPSVADDDNLEEDVRGGTTTKFKRKVAPVKEDRKPKAWDPQYTNPIYFGYTAETVGEHDKKVAEEKAQLKARENRAINRARASRSVAIDALEKTTTAQASARQDKIDKLEAKYATTKKKREADLERSERELLGAAFAIYEVQYCADS